MGASNPKNILVLCTGNSCRSQIAEGFLKAMLEDQANVYSAGVETHGVNPRAIAIMNEIGIDLSDHTSNHIDEYLDVPMDLVITVCDHAKERCPVFPAAVKSVHHNFPDPAKADGSEEEIAQSFRDVREQIRDYLAELTDEMGLSNHMHR